MLINGTVEVTKYDENSHQDEKVGRLGRGSFFGEMALLGLYERTATVTTIEETDALELTGTELHELFYDNPHLGMKFYRSMSRGLVKRLRDTTSEVSFLKGETHK